MESIYKFGWLPNEQRGSDDSCVRYEYPDIYAVEKTSGPERLVIAPSAHQVSLLIDLPRAINEPFGLYVLAVPRGESYPGRYQTANAVSRAQAEEFLNKFNDYFEKDGLHDIWIASTSGMGQLVYDKHNVIYAYGPLPEFEGVLASRGLKNVEVVRFPSPHVHNDNSVFDDEQQQVLQYWGWKRTPLRESDD